VSGIRERVTVRHEHRSERHAWAGSQLRHVLTDKAAWAGVPVRLLDPARSCSILLDRRNTSRTCAACGHCETANRRSQAEFRCQRCGFAAHADYNAARTISSKQWAAVNRPLAATRVLNAG
jgi:transposase